MSADKRTHPLRLILAGIQPMLFGWAIVVVLGIFSYTLMADSPALGETTWQDVAGVTTGWWLTAFGGSLHFDGVTISLPPLLVTGLTFSAALGLIRKLPIRDWKDTSIVVLSAALTTSVLGLLAPAGSVWWPAGIGAALIAFLAVLTSRNRGDWFGEGFFTTTAGRAVYDGFILARRAFFAVLILAALGLLAAIILGWSDIVRINSYYVVEWHSNLMMWLFQLAYLPTFIAWAFAYIVGAGFAVGVGTHFSVFEVTSAPLPAIPMLGVLPQPGTSRPWILVILVLALFVLGTRQARSFPDLKEIMVTGGISIIFLALFASVTGAIAQGAIGPDRMASLGPEAPAVAGMTVLFAGVPHLLGSILAHHTLTVKYWQWWRAARGRVRDAGQQVRDRAQSVPQREQPGPDHRDSAAVEDTEHVRVLVDDPQPEATGPTATTAVTAHTAPESGRNDS